MKAQIYKMIYKKQLIIKIFSNICIYCLRQLKIDFV